MKAVVKRITPVWLQLSFVYALEVLMETICMVVVGKMNDTAALAAVGLAFILTYLFMMSIMFGLNTAIETLASQAYGADNLEACGKYLNRQRFILCVLFVPIFVMIIFSESILEYFD
jgi:MATE family multidrug resistance protein